MAELDRSAPARPRASPEDLGYDLEQRLRCMVRVHARIPEGAFTAGVLGTERTGYGAVLAPGTRVLTIAYLVTEAESVWLTLHDGTAVEAHVLGCDQASGLGVLAPLAALDLPGIEPGCSSQVAIADRVCIIGHGGADQAVPARIVARHEFAGYWEYLLEEALFAAPAHPQWGGAALLGADGRLLGTGSLLLQEHVGTEALEANMFVPVDLLDPVLRSLPGGETRPPAPRPWLGMYATVLQGKLVVAGVSAGAPAQRGGVRVGDVLLEVGNEPVDDLADLWRTLWRVGVPGQPLTLGVSRARGVVRLRVVPACREEHLMRPLRH